jgi:hypothetical protein
MDPDIIRLTTTAQGELEMKLAYTELTPDDREALFGYEWVSLAGCTLERVPGKQNWLDEVGGLPEYICEVARSIHLERGKSISNAIQIALGTVQRWARGQGNVNADTRAKAVAALAEWTAKRAKAKAT